jgi:hypothetical protein
MNNYSALPDDLCFPYEGDECIQVTSVESVTEKLRGIDKSKAGGHVTTTKKRYNDTAIQRYSDTGTGTWNRNLEPCIIYAN